MMGCISDKPRCEQPSETMSVIDAFCTGVPRQLVCKYCGLPSAQGIVVLHMGSSCGTLNAAGHLRFQFLAHDSSLSVVSADAPVVAIQSRAPTRKLTDVVPVCRVIFMESHDSL